MSIMNLDYVPAKIEFNGYAIEQGGEHDFFSININTGCTSENFATCGSAFSPTCSVSMTPHEVLQVGVIFEVFFKFQDDWQSFGKFVIVEDPICEDDKTDFSGNGMLSTVCETRIGFSSEQLSNGLTLNEGLSRFTNKTGIEVVLQPRHEENRDRKFFVPAYDDTEEREIGFVSTNITAREFIAGLALLCGGNAIERNGKVYIVTLGTEYDLVNKFDEDCWIEFKYSQYIYIPNPINLTYQPFRKQTLRDETFLIYTGGDKLTAVLEPKYESSYAKTYELNIECDWIGASLKDGFWSPTAIQYNPCDLEFAGFHPSIYAGNRIQVEKDGKTYTAFLATVDIEWDGGILMRCSSKAPDGASANVVAINSTVGNVTPANIIGIRNDIGMFKSVYANYIEANDAKITNLEATSITTDNIKAEIAELGYVTADEIHAEMADFGYITTDEIDAKLGTFGYLKADTADIKYATITNLTALSGTVDALSGEFLNYKQITSEKIDTININVSGKLNAEEADIRYANLQTFNALSGTVGSLSGEFLSFKTGDFDLLKAKMGEVSTLLFGSASGTVLTSQFSTSVISNITEAVITDAMIKDLSAAKITSGSIYTNLVDIVSQSGNFTLKDNTIQIKDAMRTRVQIGKDASNDYNMYIWDKNGQVMFDALGLTASGIQRQIIRDDMVSDAANIDAKKLNISSLFTEMNGSTEVLKGSRIQVDTAGQTLDIAFTTVKTSADNALTIANNLLSTVTSQGMSISAIQNQITQKIWQSDINTATGTINSKLTSMDLQLGGISLSVSDVQAKYDNLAIGGRNFMLSSDYVWTQVGDFNKSYTLSNTKGVRLSPDLVDALNNNRTMTMSVMYKTSNIVWGVTNPWAGYEMTLRLDDNTSLWWGIGGMAFNTNQPNFTKITSTRTLPAGKKVISIDTYPTFLVRDCTGTVTMRNFQIEVGNKATDWTPAPEDVEMRVTAAEAGILLNTDRIALKVGRNELISSINQSPEAISIEASKINLTGAVTISALANDAKNSINSAVNTANSALSTAASKKDSIFATFNGAGAANLYCYLCRLTITGAYINTPIKIEVNQRGRGVSECHIKFASVADADPSLAYFGKTGEVAWYIVKVATSTWDVYITKSESWDSLTITDYINHVDIICTWKCINANAVSGWTTAEQLASYYTVDPTVGGTAGSNSLATSGAVDAQFAKWCYANNKTYIDGGKIYTGTITADKINVNDLFSRSIMATGSITGAKLIGGSIEVSGGTAGVANNGIKTWGLNGGSYKAAWLINGTLELTRSNASGGYDTSYRNISTSDVIQMNVGGSVKFSINTYENQANIYMPTYIASTLTVNEDVILSGYSLKEAIKDSGWLYPTLHSYLTPYDTGAQRPRYRKIGKVVTMQGAFKVVTSFTGSITAFTLPSGYRPGGTCYLRMQGSMTNTYLLQINPSGEVTVSRYGTTSEIAFPVSAWLTASCSWMID